MIGSDIWNCLEKHFEQRVQLLSWKEKQCYCRPLRDARILSHAWQARRKQLQIGGAHINFLGGTHNFFFFFLGGGGGAYLCKLLGGGAWPPPPTVPPLFLHPCLVMSSEWCHKMKEWHSEHHANLSPFSQSLMESSKQYIYLLTSGKWACKWHLIFSSSWTSM